MDVADILFAMRVLPLMLPILATAIVAFAVQRRAVFLCGTIGALLTPLLPQPRVYADYSTVEGAVLATFRDAFNHSLYFGWIGAMLGVGTVLVAGELFAGCKALVRRRNRRRAAAPILLALCASLLVSSASAADFNRVVDIGDKAPTFSGLEGTDGQRHALADFAEAKAVVVAFTCNTCPMAKAYEERFIKLVRDFRDRDVAFVAINCNTGTANGMPAMKERADQRRFNFPYLHDATQATGRAYGATVTPHLFVLDEDRRIAYMGAFDDKQDPEKARRHYVRDALEALLAGREPEITETRQFGCSIEYRKTTSDE